MAANAPTAETAAIVFSAASEIEVADAVQRLVTIQHMRLTHALPAIRTLLGPAADKFLPLPEFTTTEKPYDADDEDSETYTETVPVGDVHFYGYQVPGSIARCGAAMAGESGHGSHVTRRYSRTTCDACLELLAEDKAAYVAEHAVSDVETVTPIAEPAVLLDSPPAE